MMKGISSFTPVFSSRLAPSFARYVDLARRNAVTPYCSSSFISWAVCAPAEPCASMLFKTTNGPFSQAGRQQCRSDVD